MVQFKDFSEKYIKPVFEKMFFFRKYFSKKIITALILIPVFAVIVFTGVKITSSKFRNNYDVNETVIKDEDSFDIEIEMSDFLIPEEITSAEEFRWVPFRGVKEKWSQEDAEEFWIKPETTVRETAAEKNRRNIDNIFESVP